MAARKKAATKKTATKKAATKKAATKKAATNKEPGNGKKKQADKRHGPAPKQTRRNNATRSTKQSSKAQRVTPARKNERPAKSATPARTPEQALEKTVQQSPKVPEATDPNGWLSNKQWQFVENVTHHRMTKAAAARAAGYSNCYNEAGRLMRLPKIQQAIQHEREEFAKVAELSRQDIIEGFQEAIHTARVQGDAGNMISGWRELAKLTGMYEPTKVQHDISQEGKALLEKLEQMPDDQLLEMADKGELDVIEGEFTEAGSDDGE